VALIAACLALGAGALVGDVAREAGRRKLSGAGKKVGVALILKTLTNPYFV
jgi:ABC-type sugar transport system substrate-binding protein